MERNRQQKINMTRSYLVGKKVRECSKNATGQKKSGEHIEGRA